MAVIDTLQTLIINKIPIETGMIFPPCQKRLPPVPGKADRGWAVDHQITHTGSPLLVVSI